LAERLIVGMEAPDFNFNTPWRKDLNFYQFITGKSNFLFFLRYYGCTICQLEIHHLIKDYPKFAEKEAQVLVVLQSDPNLIKEEVKEKEIPFTIICNPSQSLYELYQVKPALGKPEQPSPGLLKKREEVRELGITHGAYEGNELQLPATFFINQEKMIEFAYYGSDNADIPAHDRLLALI